MGKRIDKSKRSGVLPKARAERAPPPPPQGAKRAGTTDRDLQAAYGNGTISTLVFDEPLVITADPASSQTTRIDHGGADHGGTDQGGTDHSAGGQRRAASVHQNVAPVVGGGSLSFEPLVITGRRRDSGAGSGQGDADTRDQRDGQRIPVDATQALASSQSVRKSAATPTTGDAATAARKEPWLKDDGGGDGLDPDRPATKTDPKAQPRQAQTENKTDKKTGDRVGKKAGDQKAGADDKKADKKAAGGDAKVVRGGAASGSKKPAVRGGGRARLNNWRASIRSATIATPQPDLGGADGRGVTVIRAAGKRVNAKRKIKPGALVKSAKDAVSKPPKPPKQLPPPPPSPVPAADIAVNRASNKKLPKQTLPVLKVTPKGTVPEMSTQLGAETGSRLSVPRPADSDTARNQGKDAAGKGKKPLGDDQVKKLQAAGDKAPDKENTAKAGQLITLDDTAPVPTPGVELGTRGQSKEKVAGVLAEIKKTAAKESGKIVQDAREQAYPKRALQHEYPELGEDMKATVRVDIDKQVDAIRKVADISAEELDAAIKTRSEKAKQLKEKAHGDLDKSKQDVREKTQQSGDKVAEKIAGARSAVDDHNIQQATAVSGETDPEVIKLRRDKSLRELTGKAARQDLYYERAGERRAKALSAAHSRMRNAYKNAITKERKGYYDEAIKAEKPEKEANAEADRRSRADFEWAARQTLALKRSFADLNSSAAGTIKGYRSGIKTALKRARELVREWARNKIAEQESWLDKFIRMIREWFQDARHESDSWQVAREEALRDDLVGDLNLLDEIDRVARSGVDVNVYLQERGLDATQATILKAYYQSPPDKRDAIGAVAIGMRMRVRAAHLPRIKEKMKSRVQAKPGSDWLKLGRIGNAEKPPFNVVAIASDLHKAMDQWGTEEQNIYAALAGLTPIQATAVRGRYLQRYGLSLDEHLKSELGGAELTRAKALLQGNQTLADVSALHEAMSGPGTDEDTIMQVLRNKTAAERQAIVDEYRRQYGRDLNKEIKSELDDGWSSHHDHDRAKALMAGDTAKADAIAIDQAMHGGWFGAGTEEGDITKVYEKNRAEVEALAAQKGWTTAQMEAEIKRRNQQIEARYEAKYGDPKKKPGGESALRRAFKSELSREELDLAVALADNDPVKADAARLQIEKNSFITDDEAVNKILASQHDRAKKDVTRDANLDLQFRAEVDDLRGKPWNAARWGQERKNLKAHIEKETAKRSKLYMGKLEQAYDSKYSRFGKGGLQVLIAFNMSGTEQQKARDLLAQGGKVKPEQEIYYAVTGAGTDVDALRRIFKDKSPAEVKKIREAWAKRYPNEPPLDKRIMSEVSGRDSQDMKWALKGEPQTLEGKLKRSEERLKYEKDAYWLGDYFADQERADMQAQYDQLKKDKARLDKLAGLKAPPKKGESKEDYARRLQEYEYWKTGLDLQQGYFDRSVQDHRTAVDTLTDTAATIAGIVATIVVIVGAIVLTVVTGGTAAAGIVPALAAAAGSVMTSASVAAVAAGAAAVATVGTKLALKGGAYSMEEMGVDLAVGVVDAAASYLTAGMGGALLKTARGMPMGRLAKMAASNKATTRLMANALAEGAEGLVSTLPSALTGNILKEQNWVKGSPLTNILTGTIVETGIGTVLSGGLGSLGGLSKHADGVADALPGADKALRDQLAETGDVLGKRGNPAERLALWKDWQQTNPGKSYSDFLGELDAGIITKEASEAAAKAVQREMRGELLSAIPPAQRGQFADVPIEVMSEADFRRFTNSASGQAVVIFENGKPRVILREGADPKVLREEGIHLLQSQDPKFARQVAELDETRLANWQSLDLEDQLRLYQNKVDLEIDAQQRLIKSLDEQLAGIDDPALRKSLLAQRQAAMKNLDNLSRRLDEVTGLTPTERLKIARGELDPPPYLDQKPRLFSKEADDIDWDAETIALEARRQEIRDLIAETRNALRDAGVLKADPLYKEINSIARTYGMRLNAYAKTLAEFIADPNKDPASLFDISFSLKKILNHFKNMASAGEVGRLTGFGEGFKGLLRIRGLSAAYIDPFVDLSRTLRDPRQLFGLMGDLATLTSFRHKMLPEVADLLGKVSRHGDEGVDLAQQFSDELTDLAAKVRARDGIKKANDPDGWLNAQKAVEDAATALKQRAGDFGLSDAELGPVLEEFARSGRFSWKTFKEGLSETYPLDKEKFARLKTLVEQVKAAVIKGDKSWLDSDIGPILHWGPVLKKLFGELDAEGQDLLIKQLKEQLTAVLPNLSTDGYKKYRHLLKDRVIERIMKEGSAAEQFALYKQFRDIVKEQDSASLGEYFASFRRKIFDPASGSTPSIQGELAGSVDLPGASRKLEGLDQHGGERMADGAMDIQSSASPPRGPEPGRYLVEDKAGKSFDLDQAKAYSAKLDELGELKTGDPEAYKGLVYFCEDSDHARDIANKLANQRLNKNIYVATFDADKKLVFISRPASVPAPHAKKAAKRKKPPS